MDTSVISTVSVPFARGKESDFDVPPAVRIESEKFFRIEGSEAKFYILRTEEAETVSFPGTDKKAYNLYEYAYLVIDRAGVLSFSLYEIPGFARSYFSRFDSFGSDEDYPSAKPLRETLSTLYRDVSSKFEPVTVPVTFFDYSDDEDSDEEESTLSSLDRL